MTWVWVNMYQRWYIDGNLRDDCLEQHIKFDHPVYFTLRSVRLNSEIVMIFSEGMKLLKDPDEWYMERML